jgi:S1-C subfamily serine protease
VQRKRVGESLEFKVIRAGKEISGISLTIADASKAPETRQAATEELAPGSRVQIKEPDSLTLALLKKKGWVRGGSFLFVDSVAPDSPFATRLQPGDVILGINQVPTAQFAALRQQIDLNRTTNQPVQLQIWRDDNTTFALTLP